MGIFSLSWFICVTFFLGSVLASHSKNGYIFTCPRSLKIGASNQLHFWRSGELNAGELKVIITYQNTMDSNETIAIEQTFDIDEGEDDTLMRVSLEPTENYVFNGKITINGTFGDEVIGGTEKVSFSTSRDNIVFLQTDKPLYKEGQTVKFRVLRVDKNLRPSVKDQANIWVEDPAGTRLFQWKNVSMKGGIRQFDFPLADEPTLGEWKISSSFQGEITTTNFEVKEYVLPTFEVKITQPPFVLANAEEIPIKVCAKYTYGKPVRGVVRINSSLEMFRWGDEKFPVIEHEGKINGCYEYTVNVSLLETESYYNYRRIQIVASVEESGTGTERNETQYIQRQYSPLSLTFNRDQRQFYKPGLPYNGKLFVKNPDDSPAPDEGMQLCYTVTKERVVMDGKWKATRTVKYCQNYTSDENGVVEFVIPRQNTDSTEINVEAKSLKYAKDRKRPSSSREDSLSQPETSMSLSPWYSPSGSFMQLQQVQETLLCGTTNRIKVLFTSKTDGDYTFYYQVLSQGRVVQRGSVEKSFSESDDVGSEYEDESKVIDDVAIQIVPPVDPSQNLESSESPEEECKSAKEARYVPPVGEVDIDLEVDASWSPYFHLLVYYVRDDRETIADSQKFSVQKCFKNQVKFQFGDAVKQPGTKTSIKVTSSPNSLCGIKVVDKSVALMNSEDQLTPGKVFRALESLDNGMYYGVNHCNDKIRQPGLYAHSFAPRPPQPWSSSSYEDSLAAFENAGYLVISNLILFTRPCKSRGGGGNIVYDSGSSAYMGGAVHSKKKVAMASTARRPPGVGAMAPPMAPVASDKMGEFATKSVVDVRDYFPETWLFDIILTNENGELFTKEKLPHTITEWVGSAVCINDEDGLGLSNTTSIKGFQAFFISTTLPYSVIRGESFWITISVFSYVDDPLPVKISMDELEGFKVVSEPIDRVICIDSGSSVNLKVQLQGTELGSNNITVRAESAPSSDACEGSTVSDAVAKDAIRKSVIVEAEGWTVEEIESVLFCPKDEENEVFKRTLTLKEPEDVVPDSSRAYLDVTGNVLGKSLDNLENLVSLPTGCGEQNMVKFAPNVVAMDMLINTNQLTDKTKERILRNLNTGAQRQMKFRHPDGSYSAFGTRDKEGSMFLTAFVLRYFSEASRYITIDSSVITRMQDWITSKQQPDGCFPDIGKIIDRSFQGALKKDKSEGTITAYVVASLLISNYKNQTVLDRAISCFDKSQDSSLYATFLYAYAEALAGKEDSAKERIDSARDRATTKGKILYYHDLNATEAQDIETSSYAILSILNSGGSASAVLPIVQYLTQNMNPRGGFYSTQDTCVGLEALGQFSELTFKDSVDITITATGGIEKEIEVTEDEKLIVKRYKVNEVPSEINVEATGSGCAVIQEIFRYNSKTSPEKRSFHLEAAGKCSDDACKKAKISLSFSFIPEGKETGMAVLEVKMVTGMSPLEESLKKLLLDKKSKVMQYEKKINTVIVYFDKVTNGEINLDFEVEKVVEVENSQPGTVKLYDYYTRDISSSTSYSFCEKSAPCSTEP